MESLLKEFIEDNNKIKYNSEEFNYNFNNHSNSTEFKIEFEKFLNLCRSLFYKNDRLVTVINSMEIRLKQKIIQQLFILWKYAETNNFEKERNIIMEFLYTYYKTIRSKEYKNNYKDYKKSINDFECILKTFELNNKTFSEIAKDCIYNFYKKLLNFGINKNIFIGDRIINRIFNNLSEAKEYYNGLIDFLIKNKTSLFYVIKYDKNKKDHVTTYEKYIFESFSDSFDNRHVCKILFELDKDECLNNKFLKKILNRYIDIINQLCIESKDKKQSFINVLSNIELIKSQLINISENIKTLTPKQKIKIKECLTQLLRLKRYLLSDDDYVNADMQEKKIDIKMPEEEVKIYKKELLKNKYSLYNASNINFLSSLENALKLYSESPLQSIVLRFSIDTSRQIYLLPNEKMNTKTNNFKKYYDKKGKEYISKHPDLRNKLYSNYYEELLKYLSKTFTLQQVMLINTLGKDDFENIINELRIEIAPDLNNDYAVVVNNILAIELNVRELLKRNNLEISKSGFDNLNNLFKYYNEEYIKNGLMYINYVLYEKLGLNLRDDMLHGNLINSNLDIALLVSFSALIFISWLSNEV